MHRKIKNLFRMMMLIADSGSTKTDWALVTPGAVTTVSTQGLNPYQWDAEGMVGVLTEELLPQLRADEVDSVQFYGSGVTPAMRPKVEQVLRQVFPALQTLEVESDLLGAARALCGRSEGIACILGTGSNSCLYDGRQIVRNTPSLGFILGDEGGGASLGRLFLNALLRDRLSASVSDDFKAETGLTMSEIIDRVYRQPLPNRFLASLSKFIHSHLDDEALRQMVTDNFRAFFHHHLAPYQRPDLPVSFVGSIACYYEPQLREAAAATGFTVGTIIKSPLDGLVTLTSDLAPDLSQRMSKEMN